MQKALWALAVLAAVALGTSIITAVLTGSAERRQSAEISTLQHQQSVDNKEIGSLNSEVHAR